MAFITSIQQETYISIDEIGVEASAFTQIDYCGSGMPEDRAEMILIKRKSNIGLKEYKIIFID